MSEIKTAQIWKVIKPFPAKLSRLKDYGDRRVLIEAGEFIEMRYQSPWHFRCIDNVYAAAEDDEITSNCEYFATVKEDVRFRNRANLKEILENELYEVKP